jgi:hypothetical protein
MFRLSPVNFAIFAVAAGSLLVGSNAFADTVSVGSGWYFTETGTTTPPNSETSRLGVFAPATDAYSLSRTPGLAPDLTSYFWNGTYITPDMPFRSALTNAPQAFVADTLAPKSFVPRDSASPIKFTNLPSSGSVLPVQLVLPVDFSYTNPGVTSTVVIHDDVFDPRGMVVSDSTIIGQIATGEVVRLNVPLYFGNVTTTDGVYGLRVRVFDAKVTSVLDENSFNFTIQR